MSNLAKNLDFLLYKHRLSANQLQDKSGITQSTTTRIISGETKSPRQNIIEQYAQFFKVSSQDLVYKDLARKGAMTVNTSTTVGGNNTNHGTQIGSQQNLMQNVSVESREQLDEISNNYLKDMPLLDIDAGVAFALDPSRLPQLITDNNERVATFIPHSGRTFGLKNSTDIVGVFDVPITKNDILIVEPCIAPRDGDLVLLALNYPNVNRGIIARLFVSLSNERSIKYSNNPAEAIPPNSLICGVVVEIKRRLIDTALVKARLNTDWDIVSTLHTSE